MKKSKQKRRKQSPHEALFMSIIKKRGNAGDFLETALPDNIVSKMVLSSVRVEDGSYVDENLKKHFSDIVLRSAYANHWTFFPKEVISL